MSPSLACVICVASWERGFGGSTEEDEEAKITKRSRFQNTTVNEKTCKSKGRKEC
jgi:hypothetical protein